MRALVRHGYPAVRAAEMIDKRAPEAHELLNKEMAVRPVIVDRAPTWHKFNLMAFYPHISEGHTIRVSPLVTKGFNMDFDGDQANFHVPVSAKAVEQVRRKMLPSANLFSLTDLKSIRHAPSMEMTSGLYALTKESNKKAPKVFKTVREAEQAYKEGTIGANDPVDILELRK
jgi:DNA-directed RNA polymerase beta' subunit